METRTHCTEKPETRFKIYRIHSYGTKCAHMTSPVSRKTSTNAENAMCRPSANGNKGATHLNSLRTSEDSRPLRRTQSMSGIPYVRGPVCPLEIQEIPQFSQFISNSQFDVVAVVVAAIVPVQPKFVQRFAANRQT